MSSHISGYPRIGTKRELKFALEAYWEDKSKIHELQGVARTVREGVWQKMSDLHVTFIPSNGFSFYDQVLDTIAMVGAVPERYGWTGSEVGLDTYFAMARGNAEQRAMEMTKWFDTNYHYIVPELGSATKFKLSSHKAVEEYKEARALGIETTPVLVGPFTFCHLAKPAKGVSAESFSALELLPALVPVYAETLRELSEAGARWVQVDEPSLVMDLEPGQLQAFHAAYSGLASSLKGSPIKLLLQTYFGSIPAPNFEQITSLPGLSGLGVDLVRGRKTVELIASQGLPAGWLLFAGVVDGRNVWVNDLEASLDLLETLIPRVGKDCLVVSTSSSLQHTAVDLASEAEGNPTIDEELRSWMAFAAQKVEEVVLLAKALAGQKDKAKFEHNARVLAARRASNRVNKKEVRDSIAAIQSDEHRRATPVTERLALQQKRLQLPLLPSTTIGSFPQTPEIRRVRREFKQKKISSAAYESAIQQEIRAVVKLQLELGIDVLVHGEPERNDMVEYFGEQLEGFAFSSNGWVQSYGSRCVKPPIIFGDVSRPKVMTVPWIAFAQSVAEGRPVKGMLTGPVTILNWSFVRDDQPRSETCLQIALAIQKEVGDLEAAGIKVIQIDEAALREGLPLRKSEQAGYLDWAVRSFRITAACVQDETQIHTHMCYSHFNDIMNAIIAMDADVITIENSRSDEKLLRAFREGGVHYQAGIGPGVYDIHSPRVPSEDEMAERIRKILAVLDKSTAWVNPDCGLKTRKYEQVIPALTNMLQAAKKVRQEIAA
eukprot:TRINITY_DN11608_c0_g1_i1.p1 TRINITY_DN11608_c0_g1~~TRINITY_DN11608_c0_g1_i1.p1  ORF type:complete len:774 (-),score=176.95 TRINITY_DN11608_c0_g1_i1:728-3049(-)